MSFKRNFEGHIFFGDNIMAKNKWERREKKQANKGKMAVHGKSMKAVENAREMEAKLNAREIVIGSTNFLCEGQRLVVHSKAKGKKYWGATEVGAYPVAQFSESYIKKNMV